MCIFLSIEHASNVSLANGQAYKREPSNSHFAISLTRLMMFGRLFLRSKAYIIERTIFIRVSCGVYLLTVTTLLLKQFHRTSHVCTLHVDLHLPSARRRKRGERKQKV